jgi:hypothetical protein
MYDRARVRLLLDLSGWLPAWGGNAALSMDSAPVHGDAPGD